MNLLNSHPDIHCNSDSQTSDVLFNGEDWAYKCGFKTDEECKATGFLLKIKTNLHKTISKRDGLKIIYLVRRNKLDILLSKKMARLYGCYEKDSNGITLDNAAKARSETDPINISMIEFENFDNKWTGKHKEVRRSLNGTDYITVFYNSLAGDASNLTDYREERQIELNRIGKFLGVSEFTAKLSEGRGFEKLDRRPIDEAIENYYELKSHYKVGSRKKYFRK